MNVINTLKLQQSHNDYMLMHTLQMRIVAMQGHE